MAGGTAVAARAAPTAANPATDAKADDAAMARAKPKADAAALLAGGAGADSKLRVLLVEDDHSTLVFVKALLKSCGHTGTSPTGRVAGGTNHQPRSRVTPEEIFSRYFSGRHFRADKRC